MRPSNITRRHACTTVVTRNPRRSQTAFEPYLCTSIRKQRARETDVNNNFDRRDFWLSEFAFRNAKNSFSISVHERTRRARWIFFQAG